MEIYSNRYTTASLTAIIATLLLLSVAMAATETADATVTISTYISTSITLCPGTGTFTYGSQDPGATDKPIGCQDSTDGALTITIDAVTNVDVAVTLEGTDYEKTPIPVTEDIPIENTKYNKVDNTLGTAVSFPVAGGTPASLWSVTATSTNVDNDIWFWLNVPSAFLPAGIYESTYTFDIS